MTSIFTQNEIEQHASKRRPIEFYIVGINLKNYRMDDDDNCFYSTFVHGGNRTMYTNHDQPLAVIGDEPWLGRC